MTLPKKVLTERTIETLRSTGQRYIRYDASVSGFGVRVTELGAKSFVLVHRFPGSLHPTARSIGSVGKMTLADARQKAMEWHRLIASGTDPAQVRSDTFQAIAESYLAREGSKLRTAGDRKATLERLVYPVLGHRPVCEIRRQDVVALLDQIEDERGANMADATLGLLNRILNWHSARSEFRSPLVRGMSRAEKVRRDRILSDDELRALWNCDGLFGSFVKLSLLTACRRSELAGLRRSELVNGAWVLPPERTKQKQEHVVPLSKTAQAIIASLPRISEEFVFSSDGRTHLAGFGQYKRKLDRESGVSDWRLHDLRRTSRSLMSRCGIANDICERMIGHAMPTMRATYDRYSFFEEKKRGFEMLAAQIEAIVNPRQDNVVALKGNANVS